ncbi:MAG TPA: hypothetical protein VJV78_07335 [Polyangiales bacterium]|nr:hypothetical protein [Polyangiales bacterium]
MLHRSAGAPAGLQIGTYTGSGIGLSTSGDALNLYNSAGALQANVVFGASPAGPTFPTFDDAAGLNNATISTLSAVSVHGAFAAASDPRKSGRPERSGLRHRTCRHYRGLHSCSARSLWRSQAVRSSRGASLAIDVLSRPAPCYAGT